MTHGRKAEGPHTHSARHTFINYIGLIASIQTQIIRNSPETIVIEFIVTRHSYKTSKCNSQGIEHLLGCTVPNLETQ